MFHSWVYGSHGCLYHEQRALILCKSQQPVTERRFISAAAVGVSAKSHLSVTKIRRSAAFALTDEPDPRKCRCHETPLLNVSVLNEVESTLSAAPRLFPMKTVPSG
ncbi:uncharacterized [Tachysurus ichikawai]